MNQLNEFIKMNLTNKQLLDTNYVEDKNIVLNALYKKDFVINDANEFLKNFKSTYTKRNVLNNYSISLNRQKYRDLIINPTDGDVFIDQIGNKFRLVNIYDNKFQFCEEGSFHIYSNGYSSMSGGFSFNVKHVTTYIAWFYNNFIYLKI